MNKVKNNKWIIKLKKKDPKCKKNIQGIISPMKHKTVNRVVYSRELTQNMVKLRMPECSSFEKKIIIINDHQPLKRWLPLHRDRILLYE